MEQPGTGPSPSGTKSCWTCPVTTPYEQGFCSDCWREIPEEVQAAYIASRTFPKNYSGRIATAIVEGYRAGRYEKVEYRGYPAARKPKLSFGDLDL